MEQVKEVGDLKIIVNRCSIKDMWKNREREKTQVYLPDPVSD